MRVAILNDEAGTTAANLLADFLGRRGVAVDRREYAQYPIADPLSYVLAHRSQSFEATLVVLSDDPRNRSWVLRELLVQRTLRDARLPGPGLVPVLIDAGLDSHPQTEPAIRMIGDSDWQLDLVELLRLDPTSDTPATATSSKRGHDPSGGPN